MSKNTLASIPPPSTLAGPRFLNSIFARKTYSWTAAVGSVFLQIFFSYLESTAPHESRADLYATELHWWFLFCVLFPAFVLLVPRIEETLENNLEVLSSSDVAVFRATTAGGKSLQAHLRERMSEPASAGWHAGSEGIRFGAVVVGVLLLTMADAYSGNACAGWACGWATEGSYWLLTPYAAQAFVVCLMLSWLDRFCRLMKALYETLHAGKVYAFAPLSHDPARRLGLGPLARAFDYLLFVSVLFATYAVVVRVELGTWDTRGLFFANARKIVGLKWEDAVLAVENYQVIPPGNADWSWALQFAPAAAATFVLAVIVWYPLFRWRELAGRWKTRAWSEAVKRLRDDASTQRREDANTEAAEKKADALLADSLGTLKAINESTVWPNGEERAAVLIGLTGLLVLLSWFPNLLEPLFGAALALKLLDGLQGIATRFIQGR